MKTDKIMSNNTQTSGNPLQSDHSTPRFKIAVEGCGHGELNLIYGSLSKKCASCGWTLSDLDFLIICGDFQAVRNSQDLNCVSVPRRYRTLADFHQYYSGSKTAPVLTLVIGGNHEASNYFSELHFGGWLAPNIYYLGAAGVVRYGPLRIAGLSGIYDLKDYYKPHFERLPFDRGEVRSVYHVRKGDVEKLLRVQEQVDIAVSHDWPRRIEWFGDYAKLFEDRPHFFESAKKDGLGSAPGEQILHRLRPRYWFAGHMHVKFEATVKHTARMGENIFEDLDVAEEWRGKLPGTMFKAAPRNKKKGKKKVLPKGITNDVTHFLALDKPGPDREFLELLEVKPCSILEEESSQPYMQKTADGKFTLHYDEEWLAILRSNDGHSTADDLSLDTILNKLKISDTGAKSEALDWVRKNITAEELLKIPENFEQHAPVHDPSSAVGDNEQPDAYPNAQTRQFCEMLGVGNDFVNDESGDGNGDGDGEDDFVVFG